MKLIELIQETQMAATTAQAVHDSADSGVPVDSESLRAAANAAADRLLLDIAASIDAGSPMSLEECVARIKAIPGNPSAIRRAEPGLAEVLRRRPGPDEPFDQAEWDREWKLVEAEINRLSD